MSVKLSPFNINYAFKDREHIELLKKQIEAGFEPPIDVYEEDGVKYVIDGGHTWEAYKELGKEPKNIHLLEFTSDADKIAYSRHKNINRLQQTPVTYTKSLFKELKLRLKVKSDDEVKKILRRLYNLTKPSLKLKETEEDKTYRNVTVGVFRTENMDWESFTRNNLAYLDFPLWLAEMVDKGEISPAVASVLNGEDITSKFDEEQVKRLAGLCRGRSVREAKAGIAKLVSFEPEMTTVWDFSDCNPLFGLPGYPGRIPGQIIQNLLHYYTEKGDLVVDPMAGGGTSMDVCRLMNRKCMAYDLNPCEDREDIKKHDIRDGFPEEAKPCNLIFLDPPYWNMKREDYPPESIASLPLEDFYSALKKFLKECLEALKPEGYIVLLIQNATGEARGIAEMAYIDHGFKLYSMMEEFFKPIQRISVPLPTETCEGYDVTQARNASPPRMLGLVRDLMVMQKRP